MTEQPSMGWQPHSVRVTGDGLSARVLLDDTDITQHVQGVTIEHRPGQVPVVMLLAHPAAGATFEGMAHVAVSQPQEDPGDAIAAFLANIDPAALEAAALDRDLDGSTSEVTRAMLAQLADWARGNA